LDRYVFDLTLLGWGLFVIHVGCGFDGFFHSVKLPTIYYYSRLPLAGADVHIPRARDNLKH